MQNMMNNCDKKHVIIIMLLNIKNTVIYGE